MQAQCKHCLGNNAFKNQLGAITPAGGCDDENNKARQRLAVLQHMLRQQGAIAPSSFYLSTPDSELPFIFSFLFTIHSYSTIAPLPVLLLHSSIRTHILRPSLFSSPHNPSPLWGSKAGQAGKADAAVGRQSELRSATSLYPRPPLTNTKIASSFNIYHLSPPQVV